MVAQPFQSNWSSFECIPSRASTPFHLSNRFLCRQGEIMKLRNTVLTLAVITTGLIAGLFFGYQVSVIPAFKTLSEANYIAAMQAINVAIPQDPFFEFNFLGAAIFLPVAAYLHRSTPGSLRFPLLVG